jgi:hypothetical protein
MTESPPIFFAWLKRQKNRNDPVGDLARDARPFPIRDHSTSISFMQSLVSRYHPGFG